MIIVDVFPGYGVVQVEARGIVQRLPLQRLLHSVPTTLAVAKCVFNTARNDTAALLSAGTFIQRCQTVVMSGKGFPTTPDNAFLMANGFTAETGSLQSPGRFQRTKLDVRHDTEVAFPVVPAVLSLPAGTKKVFIDIRRS